AADKGKDTRDYLAAAFPELNAWERAGADASSAGMVDAGFENQKELTKMQLDNQKEIAEMQNETCWSDWSSYYHFNYSGYRWRLLRDGRRWRSPSFSIASWPCY